MQAPLTQLQALRLISGQDANGCSQATWARLTKGLEGLTALQIQQRFAAEGVEMTLDAPSVDVGDGSSLHVPAQKKVLEKSIVAPALLGKSEVPA